MKIRLQRLYDNGDATIGLLTVGKKRVFTVEDEHREKKVHGETRIPAGEYVLKIRPVSEGGLNQKYLQRYGSKHKGMIWLQDVPGFEWVYIHPGNTDDDSLGCILPNFAANLQLCVGSISRQAYWHIYDDIISAIQAAENSEDENDAVKIIITDEQPDIKDN